MFIVLHMFVDQHQRGSKSSYSSSASFPSPRVPFLQWKVGYIVEGTSEEWTISQIVSDDGALHHENCSVVLVNKAGETRNIKSSSLRSSYKFVSVGDQSPPMQEERDDVKPLDVNINGIREYYPRTSGFEGTRVIMMDKTAYIVADSHADVRAMVKAAGGLVIENAKQQNQEDA